MTNDELVERLVQLYGRNEIYQGYDDATKALYLQRSRATFEERAKKSLAVVAAAVREIPTQQPHRGVVSVFDYKRGLLSMLEARVAGEEMKG